VHELTLQEEDESDQRILNFILIMNRQNYSTNHRIPSQLKMEELHLTPAWLRDFSLTFLRNDTTTAVLLSQGKWGVKKNDESTNCGRLKDSNTNHEKFNVPHCYTTYCGTQPKHYTLDDFSLII